MLKLNPFSAKFLYFMLCSLHKGLRCRMNPVIFFCSNNIILRSEFCGILAFPIFFLSKEIDFSCTLQGYMCSKFGVSFIVRIDCSVVCRDYTWCGAQLDIVLAPNHGCYVFLFFSLLFWSLPHHISITSNNNKLRILMK